MSKFQKGQPKSHLVRGIEVFANPTSLLNTEQANSEDLFTEDERKSLEQVCPEALLKLAQAIERKHETAVNFINSVGGC